MTSNLAPGAGLQPLLAQRPPRGRPHWLRTKVLVPMKRNPLGRLLVDTKGVSALAVDNYPASSPAPLLTALSLEQGASMDLSLPAMAKVTSTKETSVSSPPE